MTLTLPRPLSDTMLLAASVLPAPPPVLAVLELPRTRLRPVDYMVDVAATAVVFCVPHFLPAYTDALVLGPQTHMPYRDVHHGNGTQDIFLDDP